MILQSPVTSAFFHPTATILESMKSEVSETDSDEDNSDLATNMTMVCGKM